MSSAVRRVSFAILWLVSTAVLAWKLTQGRHDFGTGALPGLPLVLALTIALLWWLGAAEALPETAEPKTRRGRMIFQSIVVLAVLMVVSTLVGPPLLFIIMALAVLVLLWLRRPLVGREVAYAVALAAVSAIAALPMVAAKFPPPLWAAMQLGLVVPCLLAGWGLLRTTGLASLGLGRSLLLGIGWRAALAGVVQGALIALPWSLLNPLMGGSNNDTWVTAWWQPLAALQPGIAEEAWGRMLPVPLLFLLLRRRAGVRPALAAAVVVGAYWFAYLHTGRGFGLSTLVSTILIGTLYALPITYLWLRRGLETAVGFHFCQDFVRWVVAYMINTGLWFS
jgi:hypothetical protein